MTNVSQTQELQRQSASTATPVTEATMANHSHNGILDPVVSDNGPQFMVCSTRVQGFSVKPMGLHTQRSVRDITVRRTTGESSPEREATNGADQRRRK